METMTIDRQQELKKLDDFVVHSRNKLSAIVSRLGWSIESITQEVTNFLVCPFNESHHIPEQSLVKHLEECQWKAEGYAESDVPLSVPSLSPGAPSSIKFDEQLQDDVIQNAKQKNPTMQIGVGGRLIPRTSNRLITDFTREERCAMYEYVIANTVEPDIGDDIADMNKPKSMGEGKTSSYLELLAQERNLKRRRAKYRGVHTNKKSQTEILREIVNQQMEMLSEYILEKREEAPGCTTNDFPNRDLSQVPGSSGNTERRHYNGSRRDDSAVDRNIPMDTNDGHSQDHYSRRSKFSNDHKRSSEHRRHDKPNNEPPDRHRQRERSAHMKTSSRERSVSHKRERKDSRERSRSHKRERKDSSERRSHSSKHKKHKSKHRHTRRGDSRERSRSSRSSKCDDRKSEISGRSRYDDRRTEKNEQFEGAGKKMKPSS